MFNKIFFYWTFAFSALTCSSRAVTQSSSLPDIQPFICSTLRAPCSITKPHLTISSKLKSPLTIFFIWFLSFVWYKVTSLAAAFASYPVHTHSSACYVIFMYHSVKHCLPFSICWNILKHAVTWLVYCLIPSNTLSKLLQKSLHLSHHQHGWINFSFCHPPH